MNKKRFIVATPPHIAGIRSINKLILTIISALIPSIIFGIYQFGSPAAYLLLISITTAVLMEIIVRYLTYTPKKITAMHSALVGIMLWIMVPPGCPWWIIMIGSATAIILGKMPFGSLGSSPFSPSIIGLLVILTSWPSDVKKFKYPKSTPTIYKEKNAAPAETPLAAVSIDISDTTDYNNWLLFSGWGKNGSSGSTSPLLIGTGGIFLIFSGILKWQSTAGYLIGMGIATFISKLFNPFNPDFLFHLFTGFSFFAMFFLATEFPSTPVTTKGMILFGVTSGALTILLRSTGMSFGSSAYAIAIMSLATPLFDKLRPLPLKNGTEYE
jgi:Na+-translocating ferredoxin:NAD+ oxidoreductase RnfD subunit